MPSSLQAARNPRQALYPLALVAAVAIAFLNGINVPFLLDDEISLGDNESIRRLTPLWDVLWPRTQVFTAGRPLLNLSYALNYAAGGLSVRGYHLTNIAIHALAALALFGVTRRLLSRPGLRDDLRRHAAPVAFVAALLWAVHPVQTNSVTYLSQRAESLMGLCYLGTLYFFIRYAEAPRPAWAIATVTAAVTGMLSKEVMVTAPLLVLLLDRMFFAVSFRELWRKRGNMHLALMASWVVLGALMLATRVSDRGIGYSFSYSWHQYARIELSAVLLYAKLGFFPNRLVFDYGPEVSVPSWSIVVACGAALVGLAATVVAAWRRRSPLAFAGIAFFLPLAPTSSVVPVAGQPVAENRLYVPLAVCTTLVACSAFSFAGRRAIPLVGVAAVALGVMTAARNEVFRQEVTIWRDTVQKRPQNARAHLYYGTALLRTGKLEAGIQSLNTALAMRPDSGEAHANLGGAYLQLGHHEQGIHHLQRAVAHNPTDPFRHTNLGTALFHAGQPEAALKHYEDALRVRPNFLDAQVSMGIVLARLGRFDQAMALLEDAVRLHPQHPAPVQHRDALRAFLQQQAKAQAAPLSP